MILDVASYRKALDEMTYLDDWLKKLSVEVAGASKGITKAGVRKAMARLHEELAVYEAAMEIKERRAS